MLFLWPHGSGDAPNIVPYIIDNPSSSVVICPGGGYHHRAAHEGEPVALWLNSIGVSAFVLNYRVAPYRHPYPFLDGKRAIRYVRYNAKDWKIDPGRIGILGFSAGAHLASMVGTSFDLGDPNASDPIDRMSCRPDALILAYPVISFEEYANRSSMLNLLGDAPSAQERQELSSHRKVSEDTPPTFLWHTADDSGVPVENSFLFAQALREKDVSFELHIFSKGRHGLGLAEDDPSVGAWTSLCETWLKGIGFI